MQHTETIVTMPSSSSRTYEDHIFKQLPRNFVFGTSAIQIISAVITVVIKVYLNFRSKNARITQLKSPLDLDFYWRWHLLRHFQWFFHILPCCIFGHSGSVWNNWFNLTSKNHASFTKNLHSWHKYQFFFISFYRFLCKTGSEFFSSIISLMLVFMGCLGISDLRNPGQWYCSEGDKDRKKFFFKEIFLFEVKNIF